jgi:cold shock protein
MKYAGPYTGNRHAKWLARTQTDGKIIAPNTSTSLSRNLRHQVAFKRYAARSLKPYGKGHPMRLSGTVKFFNSTRGFGFISPEKAEKDVFVHASALESSGVPALKEGDKVSFEIEDDRRGRGKQAANIALSQ